MKRKVIFIAVLLITLLSSTIVFATDELDSKMDINVEDLVGNEILDGTDITSEETDDGIMPINIPEEYWRDDSTEESQRGDKYILQENYSLKEYVDGNLFIMADNVDISGDVNGNIFVMAKKVNISSNVAGSAFILAEDVNITGVLLDAYICSNNVSIGDSAIISREAKIVSENVNISGMINGDFYAETNDITLSETANITGKLSYSGNLNVPDEKQIGTIEKRENKQPVTVTPKENLANKAENILFKTFTALFIIGLIVLILNKKVEPQITVSNCIKGVFAGIGWIILIPIIAIILMITMVGLPFSLILLMIYVLMFFIAIPAVSLQISAYILNIKNKDSKVLLWLLATLIYAAIAIIRLIPILDLIITLIVGTYGFNLIIKTLFSKKKKDDSLVTNDAQ